MANGYPIDSPEAGYDDQNPYANRDIKDYDIRSIQCQYPQGISFQVLS